jgi:hypothetical protein
MIQDIEIQIDQPPHQLTAPVGKMSAVNWYCLSSGSIIAIGLGIGVVVIMPTFAYLSDLSRTAALTSAIVNLVLFSSYLYTFGWALPFMGIRSLYQLIVTREIKFNKIIFDCSYHLVLLCSSVLYTVAIIYAWIYWSTFLDGKTPINYYRQINILTTLICGIFIIFISITFGFLSAA